MLKIHDETMTMMTYDLMTCWFNDLMTWWADDLMTGSFADERLYAVWYIFLIRCNYELIWVLGKFPRLHISPYSLRIDCIVIVTSVVVGTSRCASQLQQVSSSRLRRHSFVHRETPGCRPCLGVPSVRAAARCSGSAAVSWPQSPTTQQSSLSTSYTQPWPHLLQILAR